MYTELEYVKPVLVEMLDDPMKFCAAVVVTALRTPTAGVVKLTPVEPDQDCGVAEDPNVLFTTRLLSANATNPLLLM